MAVPTMAGCGHHWAPACRCWGLTPPGHFLPGCPHHTCSQRGAAGTPPPCSLSAGLRVGSCPGWCSRVGAILAKGLAEPQVLGSHFTKRWEACWGCASPCDTTWVPCTLLCPPCTGPSDIPGVAHPHLRVRAEGSRGSLHRVQVQNYNRQWKPTDVAGQGLQGPGTHPER